MEQKIVEFLQTIEPLKSTLRHNWSKSGRRESSAEHIWRTAVFFIVANDLIKFKVSPLKVLKMLLIHDIPELVDDDIPAFMREKNEKKHVRREKINAAKIFARLPKPLDKEYTQLFSEFEAGKTPEAKVAKTIDRIESQLQHTDSGPQYWSKEEIGSHMLNFPNQALKNLNNKQMNKIWEIIKEEIKKINKEIGA